MEGSSVDRDALVAQILAWQQGLQEAAAEAAAAAAAAAAPAAPAARSAPSRASSGEALPPPAQPVPAEPVLPQAPSGGSDGMGAAGADAAQLWEQATAAKAAAAAFGLLAVEPGPDGGWSIAAAAPAPPGSAAAATSGPESSEGSAGAGAGGRAGAARAAASAGGAEDVATGATAGSEFGEIFTECSLAASVDAASVASAPAALLPPPEAEGSFGEWARRRVRGTAEDARSVGVGSSAEGAVSVPGGRPRHHRHGRHERLRRSHSSSDDSSRGSRGSRHGHRRHTSHHATPRAMSRSPTPGGLPRPPRPMAAPPHHALPSRPSSAAGLSGRGLAAPSPPLNAPPSHARLPAAPGRPTNFGIQAAAASGAAAAGGCGGGGGSFTAGQGAPRPMAELLRVDQIAKGFVSHWWERRGLDIFVNGRSTASRGSLLRRLPAAPCLFAWLVRPPHTRTWVAVYLGAADNLREAFEGCIHPDGSFGPASDPRKLRAMVDMQRRNFDIALRFRPVKPGCSNAAEDLISKLRLLDFPLNSEITGLCRAIELPSGRQVCEYPVVNAHMADVFCGLQRI
ncbi:hypothetical protein Rsub_07494 [Raphidocelis subcapitata]|uniref:Uncharacterized protein n=1 Tax=Raphidocelis subcapitata TaxID=307507 RepID=A0A2V0PAQ7_9CHLO|nr:hypothetical protein Rsub_07494 [Raphidocelis subcapitata]|eukprot:GBF94993.1 hypothetical protein Rsub_07494 [Raphidocelis subcapitata]